MLDKTLVPLKVMLLFRVGYNDQLDGENPEMSVVVIVETNSVDISALGTNSVEACRPPAEIEPLDKVLKKPFLEKISVSTKVEI
jgi:hypothetical protein